MAKAKNKDVSKAHYIVRDTAVGLVGDNYLTEDEAKEAAAKQFKTKRPSTTSALDGRTVIVYKSVKAIKEPVPVVDWVDM